MRDVLLAAISFAAGGLAGWLWFRSRVKKATAEARTDGLTGLLNRRGFDERLQSQHAQAVRYGLTYSIVLFDLDRFKQLNDTEGHAAGDAFLVSLATRLSSLIRESDVPARYGGDEFVILCPGTDEAGGAALATRLGAALFSGPTTASFGVAEWKAGESAAAVVGRADAALLLAKRGKVSYPTGSVR